MNSKNNLTAKDQIKKSKESFKKAIKNTRLWTHYAVDAWDKVIWSLIPNSKYNLLNWIKNNLLKILIPIWIITWWWIATNNYTSNNHDNKNKEGITINEITHTDSICSWIDVSHYNTINLAKLLETNKSKITDNKKDTRPFEFIFIRASAWTNKDKEISNTRELLNTHNDTCSNNKDKITIGAYHYYNPNINSTKQFEVFAKQVPLLSKWDFPPVLDIERLPTEQNMNNLKKWLKNRLNLAEKKYGVKPIIYTGQSYYNSNFKNDSAFNNYPVWIAHYNNDEKSKLNNYAIHQITDQWNVPWANTDQGECDINNTLRKNINNLIIK
jgi:GH25 family lysozyme M1 (1,4-beta-N-acetylmuramidase)